MSIESGGNNEKMKYGADVVLRNIWLRHSQKASGAVLAQGNGQISQSGLSELGHDRARDFGTELPDKKHVIKSYVSSVGRTSETGIDVIEGYEADAEEEVEILYERYRKELNAAPGSKEWLDLYGRMFDDNKNKYMEELGLDPASFATLSPDLQEKIAETAEEPVMLEWLDNPDSELARLYPKELAAARFAPLFKKHTEIATRLHSGSEVDLLHNTHKTATEAFVVSGVLLDAETKEPVTSLAELGGSLEILGNWESLVTTDAAGESHVIVKLRGKEYLVDDNRLQELVDLNKKLETTD
jgi:hypothetical protein